MKYKLFITPELIIKSKEEINRYDIIHLREYRTFQNIIVYHYANKYHVPYVLTAGGSLPRSVAKKGMKFLYDILFGNKILHNVSTFIARNKTEYQQGENMGIPKDKITIMPVGIDLSTYKYLPAKSLFRNKFNISVSVKMILFLGRINRIKGIDVLVNSFSKLLEMENDVVLVIVGPDDGALYDIQKLVKDLKIEEKVIFTGPLYGEEKLEAYVDADVYVLPSRYETFPMSVLEAYSCGKPVIASRVGGLTDLVIDGVTGSLFAPGNIPELTELLLSMLNDNINARQMGFKGKKFVEDNYSIENVVDKLEDLYLKIINKY